jgi:hypothetical protein
MTSQGLHGRPPGHPLMMALDQVEWDERPVGQIADAVRRTQPYCILVANFFPKTIEVLRELGSDPQVVLWKMEFWGRDTPYKQIPGPDGSDPDLYVKRIVATGHRVVPYTYNEWGRDRLLALAPALADHQVEVIPIAQKVPVSEVNAEAVRRIFGVGPGQALVGCGGLLHPAKGIEEIAGSFLSDFPDKDAHLLCSVVIEEDAVTSERIAREWKRQLGEAAKRRVHVRAGPYADWTWMCGFYRSIDLMLVNSVSDSWGRMVSESLGAGVPTIVRRADCGTNHIAPGVVLVDSFEGLGTEGYTEAIRRAQAASQRLSEFVNASYSLGRVRDQLLHILRRHIPDERRAAFDRATASTELVRGLDEFTVY